MKYETRTEEDGTIYLKLGDIHSVSLKAPNMTLNDITPAVSAVSTLTEAALGVSNFELTMAILKEAKLLNEQGLPIDG